MISKGSTRSKRRTVAVLTVILLASSSSGVAGETIPTATSTAPPLVLYLLDVGSDGGQEGHNVGMRWGPAGGQRLPELPAAARILLRMPPDHELISRSRADLQEKLRQAIGERVERGEQMGIRAFEIHIRWNDERGEAQSSQGHEAMERFGVAAYGAFSQVVWNLRRTGVEVDPYAIVRGKGVEALADNAASWKGTLRGADLYDGSAYLGSIVRTVEELGGESVRLLATVGDARAVGSPAGLRSIGNLGSLMALKDRFPRLSVFLVAPDSGPSTLEAGRAAAVPTGLERSVAVSEYLGSGRMRSPEPWLLKERDLRPVILRYSADAAPWTGALPSLGEVRTSVELAGRTIKTFELVLEESVLPGPLSDGLALMPSILRDAEASRHATVHPLASHTLEGVGRVLLGRMPDLVAGLQGAGKLSSSFRLPTALYGADDFVAGFASQTGRGSLGIDELTHYLDGLSKMTAAFAGALLGGPQGARIASTAAGIAIPTFRGLTEEPFRVAAALPVRRVMLEQWRTAQEARLAHGQTVQTLEAMFTADELRKVGFDEATLRRLHRAALLANEAGAGAARAPGGVDIAVDPQSVPAELQDRRRSVLEGRPQGETLSWGPEEPPEPPRP